MRPGSMDDVKVERRRLLVAVDGLRLFADAVTSEARPVCRQSIDSTRGHVVITSHRVELILNNRTGNGEGGARPLAKQLHDLSRKAAIQISRGKGQRCI